MYGDSYGIAHEDGKKIDFWENTHIYRYMYITRNFGLYGTPIVFNVSSGGWALGKGQNQGSIAVGIRGIRQPGTFRR